MSSTLKTTAASYPDLARGGSLYRIAIVGAASLKGKEVAEVMNARNFPSLDVKLLDDDESLGQLETVGDEVAFIQKIRAEEFRHLDFTFFASDPDCTRRNWAIARDAGSDIIDLSYALEDEPGARIRSPWLERQLGQVPAPDLQPGPVVIAHPAAVVLALLLSRVQKAGKLERIVATVFEPASEHGQKGMDELHEQTVNLLSFQQLPKAIFDAQVAFNLLARYGDGSRPTLASTQDRISKHYWKIAGEGAPIPSLLLLQAPVFHGHALAVHLEFAAPVGMETVTQSLAGEHVTVTQASEEAPSNVEAAGQPDIHVSVAADSNRSSAAWLWAATDNLRIAASTAVECAEAMAVNRPRGKIQ